MLSRYFSNYILSNTKAVWSTVFIMKHNLFGKILILFFVFFFLLIFTVTFIFSPSDLLIQLFLLISCLFFQLPTFNFLSQQLEPSSVLFATETLKKIFDLNSDLSGFDLRRKFHLTRNQTQFI